MLYIQCFYNVLQSTNNQLTTKVHIKKITILLKVTNHFHLEKEIHSTQLSLAKLQHQIISISNLNLVLKKEIMYGLDHNLQVNCS